MGPADPVMIFLSHAALVKLFSIMFRVMTYLWADFVGFANRIKHPRFSRYILRLRGATVKR